ncbi:MAG: ABC transporter permease [Desulfobulbaceae bacterium]|nr:ABC transporter permease [Desulfobulbaceae bacterium]
MQSQMSKAPSLSPKEMLASLWRNRHLIKTLVRRDIASRYRGSFLGMLWSFFNPLFMLGVYTFVFSVVFKARWQSGGDSKSEFALVLFAGLTVFNIFAECVNRAPGIIPANANYVKKVIFPLEILSVVNLGNALFHAAISFFVWFIACVILRGLPSASFLLLPLLLVPLVFTTMGISWFLASLGVFLRDVTQIISVATTALLFLTPIFYSAANLPPNYQKFMLLNPLTPIIEQSRGVMLFNMMPDWRMFGVNLLASLIVAACGFAWFQKTRKGFADVL